MVQEKKGKLWLIIARKVAVAAATAATAAAVDVGLLNGTFGALVKAVVDTAASAV